MSQYEILLGDSQIHQIIIRINMDKVYLLLQLGAKSPMEAIMLLCVGVRVIPSILIEMVESMSIL